MIQTIDVDVFWVACDKCNAIETSVSRKHPIFLRTEKEFKEMLEEKGWTTVENIYLCEKCGDL